MFLLPIPPVEPGNHLQKCSCPLLLSRGWISARDLQAARNPTNVDGNPVLWGIKSMQNHAAAPDDVSDVSIKAPIT